MAMLIKGTAVDTLWPAGGKRGNEGKKQIDCVSTNAAGKEKKKGFLGWKNEISFLVFIV